MSMRHKGLHALRSIRSNLDTGKTKKKHPEDKARIDALNKTFDGLGDVLTSVLKCKDTYFEDEVVSSFHITVKDLELDRNNKLAKSNCSCFFYPLSPARLELFPFDKSDGDTERFLDSFSSWAERNQSDIRCRPRAEDLIGKLRWLVGGCQRIFPNENETTHLHNAVNWRHQELCPVIVGEDFFDMLDVASECERKFYLTDGYAAWPSNIRANQPHVMVMMGNSYKGDEKISRAEILTILAVMMTQLEHEYLEEHCIIPVMIFSFMDSLQGRILQAHITNTELVVQKSKLYDFRTQEEFEESMNLFARYMACDRVGDTRQLVAFDINAQQMPIRAANVTATKPTGEIKTSESVTPSSPQGIGKGKTRMELVEDQLSKEDSSKRG